MQQTTIAYIPSSHLDLFWLGNYKTCLERGSAIIKQHLDRCLTTGDETFLLETVVFAEDFLRRYPEYQDHMKQLYEAGQLEVGAAYIDRWETLIPSESLIRNVLIGKRWCQEVLGIDNLMVTHPDLPSLTPQIAQIYARAGIKFYVTSRKVFEHGQIWRYRAPDDSALLVLNYPRHYVMAVMSLNDVPDDLRANLWTKPLDLEATLQGFPQGVVAVAGGAGDLADRETFRERYGRYLEEFVDLYREHYPDLNFGYTVPSKVLADYEHDDSIPEHSGAVPSVWGVAADEEVKFFQRNKQLESTLLTAETLVAVAQRLGLGWRPEEADTWQGTFFDAAFFARKDPIPSGQEITELWRMHVFTQDHNGGGKEGALSTFQKRVIQQRCQHYVDRIVDTTLDQLADRLDAKGDGLLVFNPHGQPWSGYLELPQGLLDEGVSLIDEAGNPLAVQELEAGGLVIAVTDVPSVGYRFYPTVQQTTFPSHPLANTEQVHERLIMRSEALEVAIDKNTGNLQTIRDLQRDQDWGHAQVGKVYAVEESGNDVTLEIAADVPVREASLLDIDDIVAGPLFQQVKVRKSLLKCEVEQTLTLWSGTARLDIETRIFWWGQLNQQVRLVLPSVQKKSAIAYGSPFYGASWDEVIEGSAPRNRDEISPEDHMRYREVQDWVHLCDEKGGLTICTSHPAFHHADRLEAVLLRSAPSCGDTRLYWDNAGEQVYKLSFIPGEKGWQAAEAPRLASENLRCPVFRRVSTSAGSLPPQQSLFEVGGALLSALHPGTRPETTVARVYNPMGRENKVNLTSTLGKEIEAVDFLERTCSEEEMVLTGQPGKWQADLGPWKILTVLLSDQKTV